MPEVEVLQLAPAEAAERLKESNAPRLIDVREQPEFDFSRIEGAELFPLSKIEQWAGELNPEGDYIVMCRSGGRSWQACAYLMSKGFKSVTNLAGGINAWSMHVDPNVPRY